ncbi:MAG: CvpA family protein [Steroidobacteraceae bacterium]
MTTVDYLIIALVVLSAIVGIARGFLREIIALATWIAALLIAWHYGGRLEPYLGGLLAPARVRPWAARAILLVAVLLVGAGLGAIITHLVMLSLLRGADRFLGFLFGVVRGLVILGVLVVVCQTLQLNEEHWWHRSKLLPYGEHAASIVRSLVGDGDGDGDGERGGPHPFKLMGRRL